MLIRASVIRVDGPEIEIAARTGSPRARTEAHRAGPERVRAGRRLSHVPEVEQGTHQPVDGRQWQTGAGRQLRKADDAAEIGHDLEQVERPGDGLDTTRDPTDADIRV